MRARAVRRTAYGFAALLALALMGSENAKAQTASVVVNGRVVDADGKVIDAVEIEILNPAGQRLANGQLDLKAMRGSTCCFRPVL